MTKDKLHELPRYEAAQHHVTNKWMVVEYDNGRFNGTILGENFTEAQARTCVTALNELDRKVRTIKTK